MNIRSNQLSNKNVRYIEATLQFKFTKKIVNVNVAALTCDACCLQIVIISLADFPCRLGQITSQRFHAYIHENEAFWPSNPRYMRVVIM